MKKKDRRQESEGCGGGQVSSESYIFSSCQLMGTTCLASLPEVYQEEHRLQQHDLLVAALTLPREKSKTCRPDDAVLESGWITRCDRVTTWC